MVPESVREDRAATLTKRTVHFSGLLKAARGPLNLSVLAGIRRSAP
jgi:hypothetical protein